MIASLELPVTEVHGGERRARELIITPSVEAEGHGVLYLSLRFSGKSICVDAEELERAVRAARILAERDVRHGRPSAAAVSQ